MFKKKHVRANRTPFTSTSLPPLARGDSRRSSTLTLALLTQKSQADLPQFCGHHHHPFQLTQSRSSDLPAWFLKILYTLYICISYIYIISEPRPGDLNQIRAPSSGRCLASSPFEVKVKVTWWGKRDEAVQLIYRAKYG